MVGYFKKTRKPTSGLKKSRLVSRLKIFGITMAVVLVIIYFFWGEFGFFRMWILSKRIDKLEREIMTLTVEKHDILWEIDKMKNDPEYLRQYAVENYGYARPDQRVIQFVPADSTKAESPSANPDGGKKRR